MSFDNELNQLEAAKKARAEKSKLKWFQQNQDGQGELPLVAADEIIDIEVKHVKNGGGLIKAKVRSKSQTANPPRKKLKIQGKVFMPGEVGIENPVCQKCAMFNKAVSPFLLPSYWGGDKDEWVLGWPASDKNDEVRKEWIVIMGELPGMEADATGDIRKDRNFGWLTDFGELYPELRERIVYIPSMLCRSNDPGDREAKPCINIVKLSRTVAYKCGRSHLLPKVNLNYKVDRVIGIGWLGSLVTVNNMGIEHVARKIYRDRDYKWLAMPIRGMEYLSFDPTNKIRQDTLYDDWEWSLTFDTKRSFSCPWEWIVTAERLEEWIAPLMEHEDSIRILYADVETSGVDVFKKGFMVGMFSFYFKKSKTTAIIPLALPASAALYAETTGDGVGGWPEARTNLMRVIRRIIITKKIKKIGHNLGYDINAIRSFLKWRMGGVFNDTMYLHYLIDPDNNGMKGLDELVREYLPEVPDYWSDMDEYREKHKIDNYLLLPAKMLGQYAAYDTFLLPRLVKKILKKISELPGGEFVTSTGSQKSVPRLIYALHGRVQHLKLCTHLDYTGQRVDAPMAAQVKVILVKKIETYRRDLAEMPTVRDFEENHLGIMASKTSAAGKAAKLGLKPEVNWGSLAQIKALLIDFCGLPVVKRTETGNVCLDEGVLNEYVADYSNVAGGRVCAQLLKVRTNEKFVTSFLDPMIMDKKLVIRDDGLVHASFRGAAISTGRLSACVTGDTKLVTRKGLIPISHLVPGDEVLTHTGGYRHVRALNIVGYHEAYTITTTEGKSIRATADHQVLCVEGWRKTKDLRCGDIVSIRWCGDLETQRSDTNAGGETTVLDSITRELPKTVLGAGTFNHRCQTHGGELSNHASERGSIRDKARVDSSVGPMQDGYFMCWEVPSKDATTLDSEGVADRLPQPGVDPMGNRFGARDYGVVRSSKHASPRSRQKAHRPSREVSHALNCGENVVFQPGAENPLPSLWERSATVLRGPLPSTPGSSGAGMDHQVSSKTSQSPCFERGCSNGSHPLEFEQSGAGNVVCFNNGWYSASGSSCYWGVQGRLFNLGSEASSGNRWDRPQVLSNQSEGHRADCVAEKTGVSGSDLHRQGCNDGYGGLLEDTIISIEPAGVHLIWDCSVDIDHSYVSEGGLVNHNSRPNVTATSRDGPIRHLYQSHWDSTGGWLVTRDYSGIEVRIMACMSKCPALTKVLIDGIDVHFNTQTYFFGEKANAKDKSQRSICKQTLFGNIYGQGDQGLFDLLKAAGVINPKTGVAVTIEDCHEFNQLLYEAYPGIGLWIQQAHVYGIINQCTGSGFGFIRRLQALGSWDFSRKVKSCMNYDEIRAHPDYRRLTSAVSKDLRRAQNCVDMETEILTRRGWLTYDQVTLKDEVLTKNPLTLRYEFHAPTRINIYPESNAPVVICETNAFSSAATLDHRWLVTSRCSRKRVKVQRMVTTEQLIESRGKMTLHRTGDHDTPDGELDDRFLAIIGWYLTDSSLKYNRAGLPVYVIIGQSERANPTKCDRIRILIEGITAHHHFDGVDQFNRWRLDNAVSARLIALLPGRKLTAEFVFSLSQRQARLLMDEMRQGDGNVWRGAENWSDKVSLYAEDEVERDAIQTLVCWAGKASNSRWHDTSGARTSNKLRKPITNSKGCWVVSVLSRETAQMLPQQVRIVDDHRLVWCPTVTNGTWIARRRGCVYVTGNCPVQSTAGDLTSFAALRIQERMEEEGLGEGDAKVCSVIHDDIWTSARTAEMCPHILTIMEEVMDRPWEWLPKMLPGFDPEWLKLVPIFGECELGISPKDVMPGKMNKGVLEVEIDKLDFENFHLSDSLIIREREINDGKKIVTKVTVDFLHVAEPMRPLLAERRKLKLLTL